MYTSSKLRRLRRIQRLKRQRHIALLFMLVFGIMVINAICFGLGMNKTVAQDGTSVIVRQGDTLWSIAKEYKPQGKDMREFIYEISEVNNIEDASISCGQTIVVPNM